MKQLIFTLIICFIQQLSIAQIDMDKMNKDLAVAENILSSLIKDHSDNAWFRGGNTNVKSKYLEDYGVVMTIPGQNTFAVHTNKLKEVERELEELEDKEKAKEYKMKIEGLEIDSDYMIDASIDFLADYGNLIRQLSDDDRIMINQSPSKMMIRGFGQFDKNQGTKISVSCSYGDIKALNDGEISREEFMDRVEVNEDEIAETEPQIAVFSSVLEGLYDDDVTKSYYLAKSPSYDRMDNYGVTYHLKFYSSTVHDDDDYSMPTVGKMHISKEERDRIVDEMYPDFVEQFKEDILEYAHILKPVDGNEMLVFDIILTSCDPCDMPSAIELSVKKQVVDDYRDGNVSLDAAKGKFSLKEVD